MISTLCDKSDNSNVGLQILKNIQNIMSDRASTEKNFNKLLDEYRSDILSQIIENWNQLNE